MPTANIVKEDSFRIGCGRYIQETGAIDRVADEVIRLHAKKPYIIGGETALSLTKERIEKSLADKGLCAVYEVYHGFCCREICREMTDRSFADCDLVIGVGGGNVMDAAKYMGVIRDVPVINIPTSSATCAAFTPLSVCYTPRGQKDSTSHHKVEVNCVLADDGILCRQPLRLLYAGIYDSLAKIYELHQRLIGIPEAEMEIGLYSSYRLSEFSAEFIRKNMDACCRDVAEGKNTKTVHDMMYVLIALTGVISGLARGSNQCAIAHAIYDNSRKLFPEEVHSSLHGELVAIGLIAQLLFNGEEDADAFAAKMASLGMPTKLSQVGLKADEATFRAYYDAIAPSTAMAGTNDGEKAVFASALRKIL